MIETEGKEIIHSKGWTDRGGRKREREEADRKGSIDSIKCMVIDLERVMGRGTGVRGMKALFIHVFMLILNVDVDHKESFNTGNRKQNKMLNLQFYFWNM